MATPQIRRPAGRILLDAADKPQNGTKPLMFRPQQVLCGTFYHKKDKPENGLRAERGE
jgi:hypothetical protein